MGEIGVALILKVGSVVVTSTGDSDIPQPAVFGTRNASHELCGLDDSRPEDKSSRLLNWGIRPQTRGADVNTDEAK